MPLRISQCSTVGIFPSALAIRENFRDVAQAVIHRVISKGNRTNDELVALGKNSREAVLIYENADEKTSSKRKERIERSLNLLKASREKAG